MHLFEIIRRGDDLDDPLGGGPDGPDTCFLVRAKTALGTKADMIDRGGP